jgi:c-di-AMP phosphodiesterase-like protein
VSDFPDNKANTNSREDVHNAIELMDTRTSKNEEFVITNDDPSGLIIFSCSSNLEFFTNSAEEIFVDGTFRFGNFVCTILAKLCNGIFSSVSFALSRHRWLCRTLVVN